MFGSDGFARISVQNWQGRDGGASPRMRRVRSDPGLPRIKQTAERNARAAFSAVDMAMSVGASRPRLRHRNVSKLRGGQVHVADPANFVEDAQSIASSIEGIRSSIEQFQGCKNADDRSEASKNVEPEEDLQDLEHRLLQYRYARRIEDPPPPLSLEPLFEDIPEKEKTGKHAVDRNVSPQALRRFHPKERASVIAGQAETRKVRLEAARAKKMTADQQHQQRWMAEAERYENRMAQIQDVRVQKRLYGVPEEEKSQSKQCDYAKLQMQERQQKLLTSLVLAYFIRQCKELKEGFEPTRLDYFEQLDGFSQQRFGMPASQLAKFAAEHYARWQFSVEAQERMKGGCFRVLCREHEMNGKLRRGDVRPLHLPLLDEEEADKILRCCRLVEDVLVTRCKRIRAKKHAHCLQAALRSWWPSRIMQHLRKFTGSLRLLQTWARRQVKRLRRLRAKLESEMLKVERELIIQAAAQLPLEPESRPRVRRTSSDLDDDVRRNTSKHSSKSATDNSSPPAISEAEVQRQLLPEAWRRCIVNEELLSRRRRLLREVDVWRYDFSTYMYDVWQWRKEGQGKCPKLPPYPSHVPRREELVAIISDAREAKGTPATILSAGKSNGDERTAMPPRRKLFGDTDDHVFAAMRLTQAGTTFYTAGKQLIDEVNQVMLPVLSPRGDVELFEGMPQLD